MSPFIIHEALDSPGWTLDVTNMIGFSRFGSTYAKFYYVCSWYSCIYAWV